MIFPHSVLDKFLPGVYTPCAMEGRYTYAKGSTAAGLVLYDGGVFAYSNHATDPASGQLCNAFDLVRIHRFGDQDEDTAPGTPMSRRPSYLAMQDLAAGDAEVRRLLNQERIDRARADFDSPVADDDGDWFTQLEVDRKGNVLSNKQFEQELTRLAKKIMCTEDSLNDKKFKRNALVESLKKAQEELAALQSGTKIGPGKAVMSPETITRITELRRMIPQMEADIKKYDGSMLDLNQTLEATVRRYAEVRAELDARQSREQEQPEYDNGEAEQLSGMERARALAQEALSSLKNGFIGLAQLAGSGVVNAVKGKDNKAGGDE